MPYGVEGFCTLKHLKKEDGGNAVADEKLSFKVIEFNKNAKKIVLSHSRLFEEDKKTKKSDDGKGEDVEVKKTTRKIKSNIEKTTLGDITDLAALKTEMEQKEKKAAKKDDKKAEK